MLRACVCRFVCIVIYVCIYIRVLCACVHMQKSKWALHLVTLVLKDKVGGWGTEWHQNINGESRQGTDGITISKVRWPLTAGSSEALYG